jgi:hypothetical protein
LTAENTKTVGTKETNKVREVPTAVKANTEHDRVSRAEDPHSRAMRILHATNVPAKYIEKERVNKKLATIIPVGRTTIAKPAIHESISLPV